MYLSQRHQFALLAETDLFIIRLRYQIFPLIDRMFSTTEKFVFFFINVHRQYLDNSNQTKNPPNIDKL